MNNNKIDDLVDLMYGESVVENAYASPAGKLTKKAAKAELRQFIDSIVERVIGDTEIAWKRPKAKTRNELKLEQRQTYQRIKEEGL